MKTFPSIINNFFFFWSQWERKNWFPNGAHQFSFKYLHTSSSSSTSKKGIWSRMSLHFVVLHSVFMTLLKLSFQIKQQELRKKLIIQEDSKTALRKKKTQCQKPFFTLICNSQYAAELNFNMSSKVLAKRWQRSCEKISIWAVMILICDHIM